MGMLGTTPFFTLKGKSHIVESLKRVRPVAISNYKTFICYWLVMRGKGYILSSVSDFSNVLVLGAWSLKLAFNLDLNTTIPYFFFCSRLLFRALFKKTLI